MIRKVIVFAGVFGVLPGLVWAQAQADLTTSRSGARWRVDAPVSTEEFELPIDEESAARIDAQIARLGSPAYRERDAATAALIDIGAPALPQLRRAYDDADELEVRMRLEEIVHAAYFDYHVFNRYGFLGVLMRSYSPGLVRNVKLPEGTVGLIAAQVIKDTGAQRAGMKQKDVIIALDGEPLQGSGQRILDLFSASIRARRPGALMQLKVVRGSKVLDIQATLGRCPEKLARKGTVRGTSQEFRQTEKRFPYWWNHHFRPTTARRHESSDR